jgi:hypothetical protein
LVQSLLAEEALAAWIRKRVQQRDEHVLLELWFSEIRI